MAYVSLTSDGWAVLRDRHFATRFKRCSESMLHFIAMTTDRYNGWFLSASEKEGVGVWSGWHNAAYWSFPANDGTGMTCLQNGWSRTTGKFVGRSRVGQICCTDTCQRYCVYTECCSEYGWSDAIVFKMMPAYQNIATQPSLLHCPRTRGAQSSWPRPNQASPTLVCPRSVPRQFLPNPFQQIGQHNAIARRLVGQYDLFALSSDDNDDETCMRGNMSSGEVERLGRNVRPTLAVGASLALPPGVVSASMAASASVHGGVAAVPDVPRIGCDTEVAMTSTGADASTVAADIQARENHTDARRWYLLPSVGTWMRGNVSAGEVERLVPNVTARRVSFEVSSMVDKSADGEGTFKDLMRRGRKSSRSRARRNQFWVNLRASRSPSPTGGSSSSHL